MERKGDEVHVTTTEASNRTAPQNVRYVLLISLLLAIVALSAIWIFGAATNEPGSDQSNLARPQAQQAAP